MILVHVYRDTPTNGARIRLATSSRINAQQLETKTTKYAVRRGIGSGRSLEAWLRTDQRSPHRGTAHPAGRPGTHRNSAARRSPRTAYLPQTVHAAPTAHRACSARSFSI